MNTTSSLIKTFIDEVLLDKPFEGDPLAEGRLDSLALEQLLVFIEDDLGVLIEDDEITAETFSSLGAVALLVDAKKKA